MNKNPLIEMAEDAERVADHYRGGTPQEVKIANSSDREASVLRAASAVIEAAQAWLHAPYSNSSEEAMTLTFALFEYKSSCKEVPK